MMLPDSDTAPIIAALSIATTNIVLAAGVTCANSIAATSAAAPPPAPLKSATICGIDVILTR
jgi:hypothetical protein